MTGLDLMGADDVGFDWTSIAKGAGGLLQGAGGLLGPGGGGGGDKAAIMAEVERQRLEEEKRKAEKSASTLKLALGLTAGAAVLGTVLAVVLRR